MTGDELLFACRLRVLARDPLLLATRIPPLHADMLAWADMRTVEQRFYAAAAAGQFDAGELVAVTPTGIRV